MSSQELALKIHELGTIIIFLTFAGFGFLLVFGQEIVNALWYRRRGKKETRE